MLLRLQQHIAAHAISYAVMAFLAVLGLSAGAATAAGLSGDTLSRAASSLDVALFSESGAMAAFRASAWTAVRFALLTAICGLWTWGLVPAALLTALRGFLTGFVIALVSVHMGARGVAVVLLGLLPSSAVAVLGQMAGSGMAVWAATFRLRAGLKLPLVERIHYITPFFIALGVVLGLGLLAAGWDAVIAPALIRVFT